MRHRSYIPNPIPFTTHSLPALTSPQSGLHASSDLLSSVPCSWVCPMDPAPFFFFFSCVCLCLFWLKAPPHRTPLAHVAYRDTLRDKGSICNHNLKWRKARSHRRLRLQRTIVFDLWLKWGVDSATCAPAWGYSFSILLPFKDFACDCVILNSNEKCREIEHWSLWDLNGSLIVYLLVR